MPYRNLVYKVSRQTFQGGASQARRQFDSEFHAYFSHPSSDGALIVQSSFEEAEGSFQTQIKNLQEEVQREKVCKFCLTRTLRLKASRGCVLMLRESMKESLRLCLAACSIMAWPSFETHQLSRKANLLPLPGSRDNGTQ